MWNDGILVVLVYGIYYKNGFMLDLCFFFLIFFSLCGKMDEKIFSED